LLFGIKQIPRKSLIGKFIFSLHGATFEKAFVEENSLQNGILLHGVKPRMPMLAKAQ